MIRLGLRLATAGGRGTLIALILTALSVAIGTAILLFALAFKPALDSRAQDAAWRTSFDASADPGEPTLLIAPVDDVYLGQPLVRVLIAPIAAGAPVPPGIPRLPGPGQAYVSPALAALIAGAPPDELAARFGTVVGTIGDEALRSPQELVAILGSTPAAMRDLAALPIASFANNPPIPPIPPIAELMIVLAIIGALAPVAVFVSTATRLSAARREQRLAALRLVGATAGQVTRLAVVEAVLAAALGSLAGMVLFVLVRPLIALVPLDGATWFPDSIEPPLLPAILVLFSVPALAAVVAMASLRRVIVTPLGVHRRQRSRNPGFVRLVPLVASVALLAGAMTFLRAGATSSIVSLGVLGAAFAGIIVGIVLAGPWLTVLVGSGLDRLPGGAATLLASRRLIGDPFGSFGSIAGVIMAVFVASAFFTFLGYSREQTVDRAGVLQPNDVFIEMPFNAGPSYAELPARLEAVPGVQGQLAIPTGEIQVDGEPVIAWVASCAAVAAQFDLAPASCGPGLVHVVDGEQLVPTGAYQFVPDRGDRAGIKVNIDAADVAVLSVQSQTLADRLPQLIIEPAVLAAADAPPSPTRFYLRTDGSSASAERIRTAVALEVPTATVHRAGEDDPTGPVFEEFARVVGLGLIGSLILAGCSLAVAVSIGILERRRQFALLRSAGMPASRLRALVMLQAGAPLVVVALFSAVLGIAVTEMILRLADAPDVPPPDGSLVITLGVSLLGALAVVAAMLPPLERLTRPESVRLE